jgi:hypothetical protein
MLLQDRCQFTDQPVERPIRRCAQTSPFSPNAKWQNLRWIQPWNRAPGGAESSIVDHDGYDYQVRCPAGLQEDEIGYSRKRNDHGDCSREKDLAPAECVDNIPRKYGGQEIGNGIDASHEDSLPAEPSGFLEHERRIVGNNIDAVQLRKGLGGHGDENSLSVSLEHVAVRPLALLALQKDVHLDLAVLVSSFRIMNIALSIEIGYNHDPFFVMVVVKEPSTTLSALHLSYFSIDKPRGFADEHTSSRK